MAICTHPVLSGNAIEKIEKSAINKLVVSDSINLQGKPLTDKFQVLSCANLFGEAIMRISGEKSVSSLFNDYPD
jgi:ribose-phosphate pyrophosphokinase